MDHGGVLWRMNNAYQEEIRSEVPRYVEQLKRIMERSRNKSTMLHNDLQTLSSVLTKLLQSIAQKYNDLGSNREAKNALNDYKTARVSRMIKQMAKQFYAYYRFHANFVSRTFREPMRLLQREKDRYPEVSDVLNELKNQVVNTTDNYQQNLANILNDVKIFSNLNDDQIKVIEYARNDAMEQISDLGDKTTRLYSASAGLADMATDPQIWCLYAIKAVRFGLLSLAVYLAGAVFMNMYTTNVYTNNRPPPSLVALVGLVVAVDMALNVMMLLVLWMARRITMKATDMFVLLDDTFFKRFLVDYFTSTLLLLVISIIIAEIFRRKPVFNYATDGIAIINTLKSFMWSVGGPLILAPFFLLV